MTVKTTDIIRWILTFMLVVFHCSVTYFIFFMMKIRKNKIYNSPFFLLYFMLSIADIATIINNFLSQKIILIDSWKPWFFDHPEWDTVLTLLSGYLIYFQMILHASIAINRAWMAFSFMGKNNFFPKWGNRFIWFLPIIPFAILNIRFAGHEIYFYTKDGELASKYQEDYIAIYHSIAGPSVVLSTSAISFTLAIATIVRYQYLFKQYKTVSSSMKQDILLFSQAFVVLIFQFALACYYIMRLIATAQNIPELQAFALRCFGYISDISSLINPIALLLVCKFIRKDYIDFMMRRKNFSAMNSLNNNGVALQPPTRTLVSIA